jgi:hypothetical protein
MRSLSRALLFVLAQVFASLAAAKLVTLKQELFQSHAAHLPGFQVLLIHNQLTLTIVDKDQAHLKHLIAFVASN